MSDDRTAAARQTNYANIEHDQARQARAAADALFKPRAPILTPSPPPVPMVTDPWAPKPANAPAAIVAVAAAVAAPAQPPRVPRVLTIAAPPEIAVKDVGVTPATPVPVVKASVAAISAREPRAGKIEPSDHRRIRALAFYGQTIRQIADDYGVAADIVAPVVMQHVPAGQDSLSPS